MKKIKFKLSLGFLILFSSTLSYGSIMMPDENGDITINNVKKTMLGHINQVLVEEPNSFFTTTHMVTYNENKFSVVGTVANFPEQYLEFINSHQYTYLPFYTIIKIDDYYEQFGAILVGHKDRELARRLMYDGLNNLFPKSQDDK